MSDDIVVVDNGSTYETQESAIVAKNEADRAEQWAKYSEEKANLSDERAVDAAESSDAAAQAATAAIEAKQYAETAITDENLIIVATDLKSDPSNIKKTAGSIDNVNTVVNDIENINAVAANKVNIDKVAAVKDNIATVATNIVNVNTVAKNIDNVNLLAPHTEAMEALAPDIMDVVTVAGIAEQTKNVSENMAHVVAVDNNKANIDKAVANATNITTVATSINNVNAVAGNKANIDNVAANKTNINTVSANITAVNNVSENMADVKNAVQSANDAKLWAVGTKTEKPEGSSKYWAEQAQQAAQVYDATETVKGIVRLASSDEVTAGTNDSAAITPLKLKSKLDTKQDKSTAVNYNNISNCITYIPQDIKLELNNGTLTLKAGSKVYIPNGFESDGTTKKFDVVTIDSDKVWRSRNLDYPQQFVFLKPSQGFEAVGEAGGTVHSGATAPSGKQYMLWYDTSNNFIKWTSDSGSSWVSGNSFPLSICSSTQEDDWTSIDQVFNGFGYIGSTVFALPGVKGLIPNGINADGSLKNIEFTTTGVKTFSVQNAETFVLNIYDGSVDIDISTYSYPYYFIQKDMPTGYSSNYALWYDTENNIIKYTENAGSVWTKVNLYNCALGLSGTGGRIISFTPKTPFHALDYNDKSTISGLSMPSSRFIDLTLGANGSSYTAPANGWVQCACTGTNAAYFELTTDQASATAVFVGGWGRATIPILKGERFNIYYGGSGFTKQLFKFTYAEGEN